MRARSIGVFRAILDNDVDRLQRLLQGGESATEADPVSGDTPLHAAARHARFYHLAILCEAGANPDAANAAGELPLDVAAGPNGFVNVVSGFRCGTKKGVEGEKGGWGVWCVGLAAVGIRTIVWQLVTGLARQTGNARDVVVFIIFVNRLRLPLVSQPQPPTPLATPTPRHDDAKLPCG